MADAQTFGERLHVTLEGGGDAVTQFTAALERTPLRGAGVREVPPSLEDVFIARIGGKEELRA